MAYKTTIQENSGVYECRENIPPGGTAAAGNLEDVVGCSSTQQNEENKPLSDTCTVSTPAPKSSLGEVKEKSRISGLQTALTPILKYLNIGNKHPSPEPLKHKNNHLNLPFFPLNLTTANCQKSATGSVQPPNSDFSRRHFGRSLGDENASVCWLENEYLPEITFLDVTCDSTMQLTRNDSALPDSVPATPVAARSVKGISTTPQPLQLSADLNTTSPKRCHQNKTQDPLLSEVGSPKAESEATDQAWSVSKTTAEISFVVNQHSSTGKAGGSCDMQNITSDRHFLQRSSGDISATSFSFQNNTLDIKSPSKQSGIVNQRSSSEAHQNCDKENKSEIHVPKLSKCNGTAVSTDTNAKIVDTPLRANAPVHWLDDRYFPEITLLDVTNDSELSPGGDISSMGIAKDVPPGNTLKDNLKLSTIQPGRSDRTQAEEFSSTLSGNVTNTLTSFNEQSDKRVGENVVKASLTPDISMGSVLEKSRTSPEPSKQNLVKSQTSHEDTRGTHPANITQDISSSSDMAAQSAVSQFSMFDMHCHTSSKMVTSELHSEHLETSNIVNAKNELLNSDATQMTSKVLQPSLKTAGSANSTFTIAQPSNLSTSPNLNTTTQIPSPQNKTLDLSPGNVNSPKADIDTREQASSVSEKTTDTSLLRNQNGSADKPSGSCDVKNATFDRHSLQKSRESTSLGEACVASFCLQNNTFESKPASTQNGTITLSETSSSDSHHKTLDKPSFSKVCDPATSPKDKNSDVLPSEVCKHNRIKATTATTNIMMVETPEFTFEVNPAVEVSSGAKQHETKDHSQSSLPMTDGISDTVGHQSMDTGNNKANTFNLDDTLDLRVDPLVTSTPMTNCKMFSLSTEREEGKILGAQKKLYGDGPGKPVVQVLSDVPSNIICDRKTFLTQPAVKSLLPPLKAASQLLKYKPTSILPGKFEPLTSGLPMTRQRTQAEVLRNIAAPDAAQGTMGISSSYNLRPTTTGSKQPNSGLPRPQLSSISSGIQRAAPGLRPPSARSNAPAPLSTDKLHGPTANNPVTKNSQAKKHPLARGESLPTAKRKKMEAPLPSGSIEASTSSCAAVNRAKTLKQPTTSQRFLPAKSKRDETAVPASTAETSTSCDAASRARALKQPASSHRAVLAKPQGHGCAKCVELEEQLKMKSEEIRHLREELLKYSKQEEEC